MEILGDDEEDRSVTDRPPVDPRTTAWAPGTAAYRSAAPSDRNAIGRDAQAGRGSAPQPRRVAGDGVPGRLGGTVAPMLDLGEQARDPAWEQTWNTGPVPLTTVRVDDAPAAPAGPAGTPPGGNPQATAARPGTPPAVPAAPTAPAAPLGARAQLVGTIASAEALGVAGVVTAFGTSVSSIPTLFAFMSGTSTPRSQYDAFAMTFALGGLLAIGLGVAACLRLRADTHPLVRGLAGAAVILGLVLVTLAAFTTIQAGDLPREYGGDET